MSIGYNLFYGQDMTMPNRDNNKKDLSRIPILKDSLQTLIECSTHFTLRHKSDVENVLKIVGQDYRDKINYEICATVEYVRKYWKPTIIPEEQKYIAIEIKDDRQWRRYHKIGIHRFYTYLLNIVKNHQKKGDKILYLSHDGSRSFYNFLKKKNIKIPLLDNSCADENKIRNNYSKIHTIYCSAGHSQMISYGLGIKIISLVSHPKLKHFCEDVGDTNWIDVNKI